jgi:hypothetical protein
MLYRLAPISRSPDAKTFYEKVFPYYDYFVNNKGDGKFLNYTIPTLNSQWYNQNNIIKEDFLDCLIPMPIFSERFVNTLKNEFVNEIDFIKCKIKCDEKIFEYYIGKILKTKKLVDRKNSRYRKLTDGTETISEWSYYMDIDTKDFLIARDTVDKFIYLVTDEFKDLVLKNKMKIKFIEEKNEHFFE